MRYTVVASLVVIALSLSVIAGVELSSAQPATDDADNPTEIANEASKKDGVSGVNHVRLASDLAQWGRDHKHPGAIAVASRIIADVPITESEELGSSIEGATPAKGSSLAGYEELLDEAKEMVKDDVLSTKVIEALAEMGMKGRGALKGAIITSATLGGIFKDKEGTMRCGSGNLTATFKKGELAAVWVAGDGSGEVDLYIFDSKGKIVTSDETPGDSCWCDWTPKVEADYTILIVNRGKDPYKIAMATN